MVVASKSCAPPSSTFTFSAAASSAAFTVRADKSTLLPIRAAVSNNTAILFPLSFHFFIIPFLLSKLWYGYIFCPHKDILLFSSHIQINHMNGCLANSSRTASSSCPFLSAAFMMRNISFLDRGYICFFPISFIPIKITVTFIFNYTYFGCICIANFSYGKSKLLPKPSSVP